MALRKIYQSEYHLVEIDEDRALTRVVRTEVPWPSTRVLAAEALAFGDALQALPVGDLGLLVDARHANGRNDRDFETVFSPLRDRALHGFSKVAYLVGTTIGILQTARYVREGCTRGQPFQSEQDAIAWLTRP